MHYGILLSGLSLVMCGLHARDIYRRHKEEVVSSVVQTPDQLSFCRTSDGVKPEPENAPDALHTVHTSETTDGKGARYIPALLGGVGFTCLCCILPFLFNRRRRRLRHSRGSRLGALSVSPSLPVEPLVSQQLSTQPIQLTRPVRPALSSSARAACSDPENHDGFISSGCKQERPACAAPTAQFDHSQGGIRQRTACEQEMPDTRISESPNSTLPANKERAGSDVTDTSRDLRHDNVPEASACSQKSEPGRAHSGGTRETGGDGRSSDSDYTRCYESPASPDQVGRDKKEPQYTGQAEPAGSLKNSKREAHTKDLVSQAGESNVRADGSEPESRRDQELASTLDGDSESDSESSVSSWSLSSASLSGEEHPEQSDTDTENAEQRSVTPLTSKPYVQRILDSLAAEMLPSDDSDDDSVAVSIGAVSAQELEQADVSQLPENPEQPKEPIDVCKVSQISEKLTESRKSQGVDRVSPVDPCCRKDSAQINQEPNEKEQGEIGQQSRPEVRGKQPREELVWALEQSVAARGLVPVFDQVRGFFTHGTPVCDYKIKEQFLTFLQSQSGGVRRARQVKRYFQITQFDAELLRFARPALSSLLPQRSEIVGTKDGGLGGDLLDGLQQGASAQAFADDAPLEVLSVHEELLVTGGETSVIAQSGGLVGLLESRLLNGKSQRHFARAVIAVITDAVTAITPDNTTGEALRPAEEIVARLYLKSPGALSPEVLELFLSYLADV